MDGGKGITVAALQSISPGNLNLHGASPVWP